ncbi:hypothetical protein KI387_014162 [Taxus chinensis]|uniref:Uncharacterized protein n=1 Tax=Taxus chinensis TaxID=29808 RepID=A0AA38CUC6_TAXCH|nr:hypothetical protein KI387_014162 [Taxus chinensis]
MPQEPTRPLPASLVMSSESPNSSSSPSTSSSSFSSFSSMKLSSKVSSAVVAIKGVAGSSKAEEWNDNMLQTGDVVEELKIGSYATLTAPFKGGKSGLQKELHKFYRRNDTLVLVRVRRGRGVIAELQACITADEGAKKQYTLRALSDPNYVVGFVDSTEEECKALQASRDARVESALSNAQLKDGYVAYPWERKMQKFLMVPRSGCFFSLLIVPHNSDRGLQQYNDLEDTLARAYAWLTASQASGVPIVFMNIQTEPLLTKISGEKASSTVNAGSLSDLSSIANTGLYGFEDYHGVDIGVVRAVRLWYSPAAGELPLLLKVKEGDTRLGFAISRTEEGFFYVSSVMDEEGTVTVASRAGLIDLYKDAREAGKFLVISRVSNEKIVPWMVSSAGAIRCYDSISLSQKLSLHRHALRPILIHFMVWDETLISPQTQVGHQVEAPLPIPMSSEITVLVPSTAETSTIPNDTNSVDMRVLSRDTAGEFSFRNQPSMSQGNSWV